MPRKTQSQGFAHVGIIIAIVLVIAAVGFGGWYVWNKNKNDNQQADNTAQTDNTQNAQEVTTGQTEQTTTDPTEGGKYLVISEWGVRFLLPEELRGDIYVSSVKKGIVESPSDAYKPVTQTPSETVSFGSKELDRLSGSEGYSLDKLLFVERTNTEYPSAATPYKARNVKNVDGFWYTIRDYKPGLSDIDEYNAHYSKIYDSLVNALRNPESMQ